MGQKKGQTGNPNGRPKGVPNKVNQPIRDAINAIVEGSMPDYARILNEMQETNPIKFAENIRALMEYSVPKMRAVENTIEMSEETLKNIEVIVKTNNG